MSDHYPECEEFNKHAHVWCICPFLRACEQRAYADGNVDGLRHGAQAGYAEALDRARDAVAALPYEVIDLDGETDEWIVKYDALAAIDALRGER